MVELMKIIFSAGSDLLPTWFLPHLPEFPSSFETYFISSLLQWNLRWSPWIYKQNRHLSLWITVTHSLSSSEVLPCIKSHVKAFFENSTLWRGFHSLCVWQKWSITFLGPLYSFPVTHLVLASELWAGVTCFLLILDLPPTANTQRPWFAMVIHKTELAWTQKSHSIFENE